MGYHKRGSLGYNVMTKVTQAPEYRQRPNKK